MEKTRITIADTEMDSYRLDTLVVGSGAAGLNAADCLWSFGVRDVAVLTEGMDMGTSRNTGSDKQTYYKLNLAGNRPDSVRDMAKTLFDGGAMHGDMALVQAALSAVCFSRLVDIGVPFPHNLYGEYIGYRTDHDESTRATSAGPLTSRHMTRKLEDQIVQKGIPILEPMQAVGLVSAPAEGQESGRRQAYGLLALDVSEGSAPRLALIQCAHLVYATGGPAGMYADSVYPPSQTGSTGIALEAGAPGQNMTEWQYGIASIRFRWNLSGSYQQVLPRYFSTDGDGLDVREFLREHFESDKEMLTAVFLKGYQWPFDPRRLTLGGSSRVDMAVYDERVRKGRRVFLDYRVNPSCLQSPIDLTQVSKEAFEYLSQCDALAGTPLERLRSMNPDAVRLYASHGIDLASDPLEIAVCVQHHNGGLASDIWWESPLKGLYPVGEVNGGFGIYRPGGSALNETQTGSRRAALGIAIGGSGHMPDPEKYAKMCEGLIRHRTTLLERMSDPEQAERLPPGPFRMRLQRRMTGVAGMIRDPEAIRHALADCRKELADPAIGQAVTRPEQIGPALRNYDLLITQTACLQAMLNAVDHGVGSRGSYIVTDPAGSLECTGLRYMPDSGLNGGKIQQIKRRMPPDGTDTGRAHTIEFLSDWIPVRPIPPDDSWFEKDWAQYRKNWKVPAKEEE